MANLNGFNAENVESTSNFDPIPAGKYNAVITASEFKANKAKTGTYLELTFEVLDGEHKGRLLWARLGLDHPNETTSKIARGHLADICRAVGILTPQDSAQLHNLPLVITVKVKKRTDTGELGNELRGFSKREATPVTSAPPAAKGIAPWKR
jgi:hypothetical protein